MKRKYYLGYLRGDPRPVLFFFSATRPTPESHPRFVAIVGPFQTKRGATFMRDHGQDNPHCRTIAEAERLARAHAPPPPRAKRGPYRRDEFTANP